MKASKKAFYIIMNKGDVMKKILWIIIGIFLLSGCSPWNNKINSYDKELYYMDTYITIKVYTNDEILAKKALNKAKSIFKEYHEQTDRYHHYDSIYNVYDLNRSMINEEVEIDPKLYAILKLSKKYYDQTDGMFNIALGNVIDVWKKYRDLEKGIPTLKELQNSGPINIDDLVLLKNNKVVRKSSISIDLGAIAKGYTTQVVGDYLKSVGLKKFIINAGGNVLVGDHDEGGQYKVGLEKPDHSGEIYKVLKVTNKAVVTSGGYERYYIYNKKRYHHIIDAKTLFPPNNKEAVSVICDDSALCDIYSTTLFIMPTESIMDYIKGKNIEVIIYKNENEIITSNGLKKYE